MKHSKLLRAPAVLLLAGLLAAACSASDGDAGAGAGQGATTAPTTAPTTSPAPTTEPTPPGGELTVTGTVSAGVEGNCLLLQAQGGPYLLVGGDHDELRPGALVTVTGRVDRSLLSICQQGVPLVVTSIEPSP